ncbi:MAG: hypothetical protein ACYDB6_11990 [Candidatus Limnocylindrales bacterium]
MPIIALVLGAGVLFGPVAGTLAKSGIIARLDVPLPIDARPGEQLTIGWTVIIPGGGGLIGTDTVLRLFPATGGTPADYPAQQDRANHYVASVVVPPGGIATIGIGIPGTSCTGSVCTPAIEFFTVTGPSGAPIRSPGTTGVPDTSTAPEAPQSGVDPSVVPLIVLLVGAVSMAMARAIWRRRRA